jgi:hypothetical protein
MGEELGGTGHLRMVGQLREMIPSCTWTVREAGRSCHMGAEGLLEDLGLRDRKGKRQSLSGSGNDFPCCSTTVGVDHDGRWVNVEKRGKTGQLGSRSQWVLQCNCHTSQDGMTRNAQAFLFELYLLCVYKNV